MADSETLGLVNFYHGDGSDDGVPKLFERTSGHVLVSSFSNKRTEEITTKTLSLEYDSDYTDWEDTSSNMSDNETNRGSQEPDKFDTEWPFAKENNSVTSGLEQAVKEATPSSSEATEGTITKEGPNSKPINRTAPQPKPEHSENTAPRKIKCDVCSVSSIETKFWFCNACEVYYCTTCWPNERRHNSEAKWDGKSGTPHEQTDQKYARILENLFQAGHSKEKLEKLHENDFGAKWFGIYHEHANGAEANSGKAEPLDKFGRPIRMATSLRATQRFQQLMDRACESTTDLFLRYPSIVSFVGETGVGKSTIIKALIEFDAENNSSQFEAPIVSGISQGDLPTSSDVHLYADPRTINTSTPILFADCEGLRGGNRDPMAEVIRQKKMGKADASVSSKAKNKMRNEIAGTAHQILHTDREITWLESPDQKSRQYAVETMYPRLLYTISDVIVFITRNSKAVEALLESLLEWAEAALEFSSNQPILPFAVILFNSVDKHSPNPDDWDPTKRTESVLSSFKGSTANNPTFSRLINKWRKRCPGKKIKTVKDLIHAYYREIRIIPLPEKGRPNLMIAQLQLVHDEIQRMCKESIMHKQETRMALTHHQSALLINSAFNHFAICSDIAFDYIKAAFQEQAIPDSLSGGILHLLAKLVDYKTADGTIIRMKEKEDLVCAKASEMIASTLLIDCMRRGDIATPELIFKKRYLSQIEAAFQEFYMHYYPCEFRKGSHRCVNVRMGHDKGHQRADGKVIGQGKFQATPLSDLREITVAFICSAFQAFTVHTAKVVKKRIDASRIDASPQLDTPEVQRLSLHIASRTRQELVLRPFFRDFPRLQSNQLCLCCLLERVIYPLSCSHMICDLCLKSYGQQVEHSKDWFTILKCPLCEKDLEDSLKYIFPNEASARILTLDGGGVRGITQLKVLEEVEKEIGLEIPVQDFFDLIVGTSCGGIIALGIGVKQWTVEDCTERFKELCGRAFKRRTGGRLAQLFNRFTKFTTSSIEEVLRESFGDDPLFSLTSCNNTSPLELVPGHDTVTKAKAAVAVTATTLSREAYVFGNYNRKVEKSALMSTESLLKLAESLSAKYKFLRPAMPGHELTVWEAARATSAAPTCFKPYPHLPTELTFQDGAISFNNPVEIALSEWINIAPRQSVFIPDILLSIGTGFVPKAEHPTMKKPSTWSWSQFLESIGIKQLTSIAQFAIDDMLDSNKAWENFIGRQSWDKDNKERYQRLNVQLKTASEIHDVSAIHGLERAAAADMNKKKQISQIQSIARRLIATSFYFHLESPPGKRNDDGGKMRLCQGYIYPRFLRNFLSFPPQKRQIIRERLTALLCANGAQLRVQHTPIGQASQNPSNGSTVFHTFVAEDIDNLLPSGDLQCPRGIRVQFDGPADDNLQTTIFLTSKSGHELDPISSFPRRLVEMDKKDAKPGSGVNSYYPTTINTLSDREEIVKNWKMPEWSSTTRELFNQWESKPEMKLPRVDTTPGQDSSQSGHVDLDPESWHSLQVRMRSLRNKFRDMQLAGPPLQHKSAIPTTKAHVHGVKRKKGKARAAK